MPSSSAAAPSQEPETSASAVGTYEPRRPEKSPLHGAVRESLATFLARAERQGRTVPRFVERELRAYLDCGILAHGFLRLRFHPLPPPSDEEVADLAAIHPPIRCPVDCIVPVAEA